MLCNLLIVVVRFHIWCCSNMWIFSNILQYLLILPNFADSWCFTFWYFVVYLQACDMLKNCLCFNDMCTTCSGKVSVACLCSMLKPHSILTHFLFVLQFILGQLINSISNGCLNRSKFLSVKPIGVSSLFVIWRIGSVTLLSSNYITKNFLYKS